MAATTSAAAAEKIGGSSGRRSSGLRGRTVSPVPELSRSPMKFCRASPWKNEKASRAPSKSNNDDRVPKQADPGDLDLDPVLRLQGERIRRRDAGPRQQDGSVGEYLAAKEKTGQLLEAPFHVSDRRLAGESNGPAPPDREPDAPGARGRLGSSHGDPRAERAGPVVDLGLREIQEILPLDVPRTHVVADGVADDRSAGIQHEGQFRLRHVPAGLPADPDRLAGRDDLLREAFEEKLG